MDEKRIEIINNAYNLINQANSLEGEARDKLLNDNIMIFVDFYNELAIYNRMLQYKDRRDEKQADLSDKYFELVKWITLNSEVFEKTEYYDFIPKSIINQYSETELSSVIRLKSDSDQKDFYSVKEYLARREELEKVIEGKENKSNAERRYVSSHDEYMKWYYGHLLSYLEFNYTDMPQEDILDVISSVEKSELLDRIIKAEDRKLNFDEENLVFQYTMFGLKMKNIFKPDEIIDDRIVQDLWNGRIKNKKVLELLISEKEKNTLKEEKKIIIGPILYIGKIFSKLLEREGYEDKFYLSLCEHFTKVGMSPELIAMIFKKTISRCSTMHSLQFLADLDIPKDFNDFLEGDHVDKYSFIKDNPYILDMLIKKQKKVERGRELNIPYEYVEKKIPDLTKQALDNIYTLIKSGYYKEDGEKLEKLLIEQGLLDSSRLIDEEIKFNENDSMEQIVQKAKDAYYNRQIIPYDIAKKLIKANYDENLKLDAETFKACVCSVINNNLKEIGIDIGCNIFFGDDNGTRGVYRNADPRCIWINNSLIENFINIDATKCEVNSKELKTKSTIFVTMFHEIQHAKQHENMENGNINYLTYNFIKEEVIKDHDFNFYEANYKNIFVEEDAREYGIINAMKFLKKLNINRFEEVFPNYVKMLDDELKIGNINQEGKKKLSFRCDKKLDNSVYLGELIKNNPELLNEYGGILKIEYNLDGTQKDVSTMISEYNEKKEELQKEEGNELKLANLYSIYFGVIKSKIYKNVRLTNEEKSIIHDFFKENESLLSVDDLRYYSEKVEPEYIKRVFECFERDIKGIDKNESENEAVGNPPEGNSANNIDEQDNSEYE